MQLLVTAIQKDSLYMHICTYHPPWVNHVVFVVSTRMIHEHLRDRCDVFRHFPGDRDAEWVKQWSRQNVSSEFVWFALLLVQMQSSSLNIQKTSWGLVFWVGFRGSKYLLRWLDVYSVHLAPKIHTWKMALPWASPCLEECLEPPENPIGKNACQAIPLDHTSS